MLDQKGWATRPMKLRRMRFILPSVGVALTAMLLLPGYWLWQPRQFGEPPPTPLLAAYWLNFPALLGQRFVLSLGDRLISNICSPGTAESCTSIRNHAAPFILLVLVGALWYAIGIEIESRGSVRRGIVPGRPPLRLGVDLILIFFGLFLAVTAFADFHLRFGHPMPWTIRDLLGRLLCAVWALAIIVTYGHDFVRCFLNDQRRRTAPTN